MKNKITSFLLLLLCLSLTVGCTTTQQNHEYVDLGLPSGTLWATTNVGAENPWDYGDYFAWGETTTKAKYDWSTYKYANGAYNELIKYCNDPELGDNGFTDDKTELERSDDAATANWGSDWCMPTQQQFQELNDKCKWNWTTRNCKNGYEVVGPNGNSIFLPAAGVKYESEDPSYVGSLGNYWSSSLGTDRSGRARYLIFYSSRVYTSRGNRYYGRSVRPVRCRN